MAGVQTTQERVICRHAGDRPKKPESTGRPQDGLPQRSIQAFNQSPLS